MEFININKLNDELDAIKKIYRSHQPFHYVMFENFFYPDKAESILGSYPALKDGIWDGKTYINQKNKFHKTKFEPGSVMEKVFNELNSAEFTQWLEKVTGIDNIVADNELAGGGLHQSINGAYLNVHVDFNFHPTNKLYRRLNVLVYMNKDWKDEYEGHLELWDLANGKNDLLGKFAPNFNRCVIFETNEISYHGHPKPLKTPEGINRKSLATYYYTEARPENEMASEHSTIYVNTEGASGLVKRLSTRVKVFLEKNLGKK